MRLHFARVCIYFLLAKAWCLRASGAKKICCFCGANKGRQNVRGYVPPCSSVQPKLVCNNYDALGVFHYAVILLFFFSLIQRMLKIPNYVRVFFDTRGSCERPFFSGL